MDLIYNGTIISASERDEVCMELKDSIQEMRRWER